MALRFTTLETDERSWCSNSPLSHTIKKPFFTDVCTFGGGLDTQQCDWEVASTHAQADGSKTACEAYCSGGQLRARTVGLS